MPYANPGYSVAETNHVLIDELGIGQRSFAKPAFLDEKSEGLAAVFSELFDVHGLVLLRCLTKKAEPPPNCDIRQPATSRQTASAGGAWLRRLVRRRIRVLTHLYGNCALLGQTPMLHAGRGSSGVGDFQPGLYCRH